ncbi:NTP transferase domain-containing protein [Nocardia abscessus]|uniref:UTP--glucose-1-phosphate uridylyltransferase n=1 Tax=Nocardia abscessus TaxID=120957 RepID=A0ABS0CF20_9NOCA|nr:sugar phosphate nucleotidyltransferase [Nocardia abscessus]MBF6228506.1 NTP transferase domain-containing protein [Nocardia abscessus]
MTVRKAVIAAAGLGTRMYPITKTIDKAMLPLGRRPAIDYTIRECARAGVEQIAIVVREGSTQIQHYYGCDRDLRALLALRGWEDKATALDETSSVPELVFFEQSLEEGYGTAIPALLAREFVGDDSFFYLSSDDLLADEPGESTLASLADTAGDRYGIVGQSATPEDLGRYGLLATEEVGGALYLRGIAEKATEAPNGHRPLLINISRYVFPATFFETLASVETNPGSGEIYLTDGLTAVLSSDPDAVRVQPSHGGYFDLGSMNGLVAAVNHFSMAEIDFENSPILSSV